MASLAGMSTAPLVSGHAVERYQERVRPGLGLAGARRELERLIETVGVDGSQPDWFTNPEQGADVDRYLWLGGDVALPVVSGVVVTCLTRNQSLKLVERRRRAKVERRRRARYRAAINHRPFAPPPNIEDVMPVDSRTYKSARASDVAGRVTHKDRRSL